MLPKKLLEKGYPFLLLAVVILIIVYRAPGLLVEPRFWAEEGQIYFAYAYSHSWIDNLLQPHLGYYSLFNNMATTVAANVVPLKLAPYVTTYLAFLVQLIPFIIILWGTSSYWDTMYKKLAALLIIAFTPALTGEIWLNTINSQFFLALITFLILLENEEQMKGVQKWFYRALLILSGLTGVVANFLTPIFMIKALLQRTRESIIHALMLMMTSVIQLIVFYRSFINNDIEGRFTGFEWSSFLTDYTRWTWVTPIVGEPLQWRLLNEGHIIGATAIILVLLLILSLKIEGLELVKIWGSFLLISFLSILLSLDMMGAPRYAYVPGAILLFLVLANFKRKRSVLHIFKVVLTLALLSTSLYIGWKEYKPSMHSFYNPDWPKWSEEVIKWERSPQDKLSIWPQWEGTDWHIKLPDQPN